MHNILAWLKARLEVIVPLLAVPTFFAMVELTQGEVKAWQTVLVYGLALVYIGVVVWSPMGLPAKAVLPVDREITRKVILTVTAVVLAGAASLVILSLAAADSGEGKTRLPYFVLSLLLIIFLGSGGVIAERGLTIDLFPELRQHVPRRIVYALVAAFFLAMLTFFWSNLFSGVIDSIGQAAGETAGDAEAAASSFNVDQPLVLLVQLLVGAGLFEELLFRMGIMTIVWRITRRWGWGLLVSALLFGIYHITPLSGISTFSASSPLTTVLTSFTMGIIMGLIFRYRGLLAAVLVHGLGDWVVIMLLGNSG